jgi:hypothetical protein
MLRFCRLNLPPLCSFVSLCIANNQIRVIPRRILFGKSSALRVLCVLCVLCVEVLTLTVDSALGFLRASVVGVCFGCGSAALWLSFFGFPITAITRDVGDRRALRSPTRPFSTFVANKGTSANRPKRDPCVTLGWPLGHAWATLGPPNPNPSRQWVATLITRSRAMSAICPLPLAAN